AAFADPDVGGEERPIAPASSGADVRFEIRLELGRMHRLAVVAEGFAPAVRASVQAGDEVKLVLRRGASVSGRVTRREDEVPIAGARVIFERPSDLLTVWEGTSD